MAYLELRGIAKRFGETSVVEHVDLAAEAGEFIVLVGASGCGKSTTLRMIAGLEAPSAGTILIEGRDVTRAAPAARDIAMVFQNYALYPHMNVAQNMGFALELSGIGKAAIAQRVGTAAELLGITALLGRKPKELSGGQRQRVAMGRAIVREPKVFLFDEPLSNLDAKLRAHVRVEIALMHRRMGRTTVYVTHDQIEAMTLADRIVVMDQGRIQQLGTPDEVFNRPANRYVAGFIGSPTMNFVDRDEGGRPVVLGVRPQNLRLGTPEPGAALVLPLRVTVCEYLGTESVLSCRVDSGPAAGTAITVVAPGQQSARVGEAVTAWAEASSLLAFEPGSHGKATALH